jgi:hypothetical protein
MAAITITEALAGATRDQEEALSILVKTLAGGLVALSYCKKIPLRELVDKFETEFEEETSNQKEAFENFLRRHK